LVGTSALDALVAEEGAERAVSAAAPRPPPIFLTAALVARGLEQTDGADDEEYGAGYLRQPRPTDWQLDALDAQREQQQKGASSGGWWWPAATQSDDPAAASSCSSGPCPALLDSGELDIIYGAAFGGSRSGVEGGDDDNDDGARLWLAGKAVLPGAAYADGQARAAIYYAVVARPEALLTMAARTAPATTMTAPPPPPTARGVIAQGGRTPLGLAFPAVAVSPNGTALFTFAYSEGGAGGGTSFLLPDGSPPFAGVAVAAVSGPSAQEPYTPARPAVVVVRRGAGPVASEPIPGLEGPGGEPVLRMGGVSSSAAAAVGGGGGGGGGSAAAASSSSWFSTATAYAATAPEWSPPRGAPTNLGVWAGMVEVEE
jgi:hypothetical protein